MSTFWKSVRALLFLLILARPRTGDYLFGLPPCVTAHVCVWQFVWPPIVYIDAVHMGCHYGLPLWAVTMCDRPYLSTQYILALHPFCKNNIVSFILSKSLIIKCFFRTVQIKITWVEIHQALLWQFYLLALFLIGKVTDKN